MPSGASGGVFGIGTVGATRIGPAAPPVASVRADRLARRSRIASIGVVVILLAMTGFALWSSHATAAASAEAVTASRLSDDYARAATAVAAEEALEHKYRLEPSPAVRTEFTTVAATLVQALGQASATGDTEDQALVAQVLRRHQGYVAAIERMFTAVDQHDTTTAARIENVEVDPALKRFLATVVTEAGTEHTNALQALARLQKLEGLTSRLTPAVFALGLLTAALLSMTARSYRRVLASERARAVHDSLHDPLTGLPNRTLLTHRFDQALRDGHDSPTGLLLIDVDRFKDINDTFGHQYGDELLTQLGARLSSAVRAGDTVARLGGDEFAILLCQVADLHAVNVVAAKARHALETPFHVAGLDLHVEASIGVVLSGTHGHDTSTLLQRADIAMYVAKTQHLGIFAYDSAADGHSPAKMALLGELRRALQHHELLLHYQPKISLHTGAVVGVEALVRWQHPTRGLMPPDAFIPLAEHTGLIGPLTRHLLQLAATQAKLWADIGRPLPIAVNLSARNLLDEQLPEQVAAMLAHHHLPASLLHLEVTESAIMTDPARAKRILAQLTQLGITISIDDFGAGYTSLSLLKTLPVNELKIDRCFVATMTEDRDDANIVHSVIELGHNLGLTIVAEGVETPEILDMLAELGCDTAQGYHIARPAPLDTLETWLLNQPIHHHH